MRKFTTAVCAFVLAVAWTGTPALARDTKSTDEQMKKEIGAAEKARQKGAEIKEQVRDKITGGRGSDDIREAQQALKAEGFDPGPIDGRLGQQTKAALSEYQTKENLKVTGRLDSQTKKRLERGTPAASPRTPADSPVKDSDKDGKSNRTDKAPLDPTKK
jgi:peptidoglycan hydrolase-like protein with peptidoglycan-binding domain